MMRTHGIVLPIALAVAAASACDVGSLPGLDPDAAGPPGGADGSALFACQPVALTTPNGNHNPGQACLAAGCHGAGGGGGPTFTVAGTLYTNALGATPNVGGTITLRDSTAALFQLVSATNGNFYTSQAVQLPVTIWASKCPSVRPMISTSATGDCNSAGCHAQGSPTGRVWLDPP